MKKWVYVVLVLVFCALFLKACVHRDYPEVEQMKNTVQNDVQYVHFPPSQKTVMIDDVEYLEIMYQKEVYSYMKSKTTEHFKAFLIMYLKILRTYLDDSLTDSPITDEVYCDDLKILKAHKPSKLLEEVLDILSKTDYNYDRRSLMDKLAYRIVKISKGDKE